MNAAVGGGWRIVHLTDRVVELRKDDHAYRRLTGRDGFVRCRAEPGMDRAELIERAMRQARRTDTEMSFKVAHDVIPSAGAWSRYNRQLAGLASRFATPEDPEVIGVKHA